MLIASVYICVFYAISCETKVQLLLIRKYISITPFSIDIVWILPECQKGTLKMLRTIVVTLVDHLVVPGVTRLILQVDGNIVMFLCVHHKNQSVSKSSPVRKVKTVMLC